MTFINDFLTTVKTIVTDPKEGVKRFVDGANWIIMGIMAVIYAGITVLSNVVYKIQRNFKDKEYWEEIADDMDMDLADYIDEFDIDVYSYEFGDIVKGVFIDILEVIATIGITAVVFFFAVKLIKKIQITWKQAFAIATIELLIFIPLTIVYKVFDLIPDFKLLSWIMSMIISVRSWGSAIITYLGLKSVCEDTKSTIYVSVPAVAVISLANSFVFFLLTSLFS